MSDLMSSIEGAKDLDDVAGKVAGLAGRLTSNDAVKNLLSGSWLGHQLHPMLTDVPIGAWSMATFLDLCGGRSSADASRKLVGLGLLSILPTAASGANDYADTYGPEQRVGFVHAAGMVAATLVQTASWRARRKGHHKRGALMSLAGMGLAGSSAYLGGHLTLNQGVGVNHGAFEHPTSDWTDVAADADVTEGQPVRADAGGTPVALVRHRGQVCALSATCSHAGGPLDEGKVTDSGCLVCPWHGSEFRLDDGTVERGPASVGQQAWEVRVTDGRIEVRAG